MNFFYQSGAMGYGGEGYFWHKVCSLKFPTFPIVTKTITLRPKIGLPFAVFPFRKSVWNRISWHNPGFLKWRQKYYNQNLILSLGGTDDEIQQMIKLLHLSELKLRGIELNYSCPHEFRNNKIIPRTKYKLYLKLRADQDPYQYDLSRVERIHLNTLPFFFGGISGKMAKERNWEFIRTYNNLPMPVAGCSFDSWDDIKMLENMGCEYIGIGSTIITNPNLIRNLDKGG